MEYIRVGGTELPAQVRQTAPDRAWNGRSVREITLTADYATMLQLFPTDEQISWELAKEWVLLIPREDAEGNPVYDEQNEPVIDEVTERKTWDMSEWCVAGAITDNRDGSFTVKMGVRTTAERLEEAEALIRDLTTEIA